MICVRGQTKTSRAETDLEHATINKKKNQEILVFISCGSIMFFPYVSFNKAILFYDMIGFFVSAYAKSTLLVI